MKPAARHAGASKAWVLLLLFLVLAAGAGLAAWRAYALQSALQTTQAGCAATVDATQQSGEAQLAALQTQFDRYREASEKDPRAWFSAFGRSVAEHPFLAFLRVIWIADFELQDQLKEGETLLGGREIKEQRVQQQQTLSSAGFLLGRRSNFIFGLVLVRVDDPALKDPGDSFLVPPSQAEIEVPMAFNRYPEYALAAAGVQIEAEVQTGCGGGPGVVIHAWRTEDFIALVLGCEAAEDGTDVALYPYEGYARWTRLTEQEIAFPRMTPEGGVAMAWASLGRKYGESGLARAGIGMPASVAASFLPLDGDVQEPVLHSIIFQVNEAKQVWFPFWAVRKQLASAREDFDFDRVLGVRLPVARGAAYDPNLRKKMLSSYQSLINMNEEYSSPSSFPLVPASGG